MIHITRDPVVPQNHNIPIPNKTINPSKLSTPSLTAAELVSVNGALSVSPGDVACSVLLADRLLVLAAARLVITLVVEESLLESLFPEDEEELEDSVGTEVIVDRGPEAVVVRHSVTG
jgi:hypothetical protein